MRMNIISTILFVGTGLSLLSSVKKDPNDPPIASTAAATEQSCRIGLVVIFSFSTFVQQ